MSPKYYLELAKAIQNTVVCILAGGRGERLMPLTKDRAKPAVPFGGRYRVIDFVMSNCLNSAMNRIYVFPQHLNQSLNEHLLAGWDFLFPNERGQFLRIVSPQGRVTDSWYSGTSASVRENFHSLSKDKPEYVIVLSSDQVYEMDYRLLLQSHIDSGADLTIAGLPIKKEEAKPFGVMEIDTNDRLCGFIEKPADPKSIPGKPDESLVSMGIYVFTASAMVEALNKDMSIKKSKHDFGKNIIPQMLADGKNISVFHFRDEEGKPGHWVDIGNPDAYFEANMDLVSVKPKLNLYNEKWPWRTTQYQNPPQKTVFGTKTHSTLICDGCILDDCNLERVVLSPRVNVGWNVSIIDAVIMNNVKVENNVKIYRAIIDKDNVIPEGSIIDARNMKYDGEYSITDSGIVIIPRNYPEWDGK